MKQILNTFALMLGFLFYPLFIILKNSWAGALTFNQLALQFLFYSYYLVVSWDFYIVLLLFATGIVMAFVTRKAKSEVKIIALYYFILATFAIAFFIYFKGGYSSFNSFNGRLYILAFYVLILKNGIFSFLGAIIVKKLEIPASINKKAAQDKILLIQTICPRCGSTFKSNPILCSYCGEIIDKKRYALLTTDN